MGIDYFHLLGDGDGDAAWKPLRVAEIAGEHLDDAGAPLADLAALDAILDGTVSRSDKIDPAFGLIGLRIAPGATTPTRHHDLRRLTIVHGGELTVSTDDQTVRAGQFFVIDEGCPYSLTAGPDGVTFIETWPPKLASSLTTYWHLDADDD